jgi:hypothetical protein
MSKPTNLSPWVTRETLRHLMRELREHRKQLPLHRHEVAAYLIERDELVERFKLHMDVLGIKGKFKARPVPY